MKETRTKIKQLYVLALGVSIMVPAIAQAQMVEKPWSFSQQNRASIAALMRNVEKGNQGGSVSASGGTGSIVNLVCGAGNDTAATADSSCIILNNSDANIDILQNSTGDQSASTEDNVNVDETVVGTNAGNVDDVLQVLSGK